MATAKDLSKRLSEVSGDGRISARYQADNDPDLDEIVRRGSVTDTKKSPIIKRRMTDGRCHWNTAQLFEAGEIDTIVVGYARNEFGWHQHTWGLKNGRIVETTPSNFGNTHYYGSELSKADADRLVAHAKTARPGEGLMRTKAGGPVVSRSAAPPVAKPKTPRQKFKGVTDPDGPEGVPNRRVTASEAKGGPSKKPRPKPRLGRKTAATVNEAFFDAMVRHQVGLLRMSGKVRNQILDLLNKTEIDLADKIRSRLLNHKGLTTPADVRRLQNLLTAIRAPRLAAWKDVTELWVKEMRNLAKVEPVLVDGLLKTVSPVVMDTTIPSTQLLEAIVTAKPFEGKVLRGHARSMSRADISRIEDAIKMGMIQGESSSAIARRVVGTRRLNGTDGVTATARRQAAALSRTAVNAISNQAKRAYYAANSDVFTRELYVATLDGRTTRICSSLDGKTFPVGEGPIPPRHFNCRSLRVAVIGQEAIGSRPARPATERGMLRDFTRQNNLGRVGSRADLPRGFKGQYDKFKAAELRRVTGTVPAKVSYGEWLRRQPRAFQDDVLGKTRSRLFRQGRLELDKFVNRAGDELPLSALAARHRQAFLDAGLDPEDFL